MTSSTILLWRDPRDGDLFGATGLLKWRSYHRRPGDEFFTPLGDPGALGGLARAALGDALRPAVDIEAKLWPLTIFAPERSIDGDWCMSVFGEVASISKGSAETANRDFI
jgi:hypothetical protein